MPWATLCLAAKCLHATVLARVSEYLLPLQIGVKVPNAAEKVARVVKLWADEHVQGEAILQVDARMPLTPLTRSC